MSHNSAYGERPQQPSRDNAAATAAGGGKIPSYETAPVRGPSTSSHVTSNNRGPPTSKIPSYEIAPVRGPSTSSHVTSDNAAQHYKIQGPVHYEVLEVNRSAINSRAPQKAKGKDEAKKDAYSSLHHK